MVENGKRVHVIVAQYNALEEEARVEREGVMTHDSEMPPTPVQSTPDGEPLDFPVPKLVKTNEDSNRLRKEILKMNLSRLSMN